jgi:ACS family hexuronate transporter-like MFS transporter
VPHPWLLFRQRYVWTFALSKVFLDPAWYFYTFWFPEYLSKGRGFDMASIGKYGWIPFLVAGAGNILGGWLAAALLARGWTVNRARKSAVTVFALLMLAAIPAVMAEDAIVAIALVSIAMVGYTGCNANMLAVPADIYPGTVVSSVYGLASMGSGFGGMLFALMTGWLVDHFSYTPVFFLFGLIPLVCIAILWRVMGPLEMQASPQPKSVFF